MGRASRDKRDIFYRKAKELGYRARSAFKLLQIDEEFGLFRSARHVVDLCAAPGSWSQVVSQKFKSQLGGDEAPSSIVAVDLQEMAPIDGVTILQSDITEAATVQKIRAASHEHEADLVLCDGAPDVTGLHDIDEYVQSQLILSALNVVLHVLKPQGEFVAKVFRQKDTEMLYATLRVFFSSVCVAKPRSSRNSSIEAFVVCRGFRLPSGYVPTALGADVDAAIGYDPDMAYDIDADERYREPVQAPINPSYKEALCRQRGRHEGTTAPVVAVAAAAAAAAASTSDDGEDVDSAALEGMKSLSHSSPSSR